MVELLRIDSSPVALTSVALLLFSLSACGSGDGESAGMGGDDSGSSGAATGSGGEGNGGNASGGDSGSGGEGNGSGGAGAIDEPWSEDSTATAVDSVPADQKFGKIANLAAYGSRLCLVRTSTEGKVYCTTDGSTWSTLGTEELPLQGGGTTPFNVRFLAVGPDLVLAAGLGSNLEKSDGSSDFNVVGDTAMPFCSVEDLHIDANGSYAAVSACSDAGIFMKANADGTGWQFIQDDSFPGNGRSVTSLGQRVYLGAETPPAVFVTEDGGSSWQTLDSGLSDLKASAHIDVRASSTQVYAVVNANSVGNRRLRKLSDGMWDAPAMTGVPGGADADVRAIAFSKNTVFIAVSDEGLFMSSDDGESFVDISQGLPEDEDIAELAVLGDVLYIGTSDGNLLARPR